MIEKASSVATPPVDHVCTPMTVDVLNPLMFARASLPLPTPLTVHDGAAVKPAPDIDSA